MSKLSKKHHTIDCDLTLERNHPPQPTTTTTTTSTITTTTNLGSHHLASSSSPAAASMSATTTRNVAHNSATNPQSLERTMEWVQSNSQYVPLDGDELAKTRISLDRQQQQQSYCVGDDDDDDVNDKFDCQQTLDPADPTQRLSKLTLSSSLHKLSDSKYLTSTAHRPKHHQQQQQHPTKPQTQLPTDTRQPNTNSTRQPTVTNQIDTQTNNASFNVNHNNISNQSLSTSVNQTSRSTSPRNNHANNTVKTTQLNNNNNIVQRDANLDTVHVVVGNEACDLDSTVSCLLMFHIISKMSDEINGKDKTRTLYIPLLNTTRDMLDSKGEVLWFLEKTLNIDKSFLTCKDDIDWSQIKKNNVEILITLVDHNYNEEFNEIGRVVEIIDHHQVENPKWLMSNHSNIRLTIDTSVGSCSTLIAERLFYIYAEHHVSDEILLLIYGTVLLDTICLSEKAKRFTRRDVYLLKKLDSLLGNKKPVRDQLYKQLVEVKNSTSPRDLNFEKLMRRDLKVYKDKNGLRVGIASMFGMEAKEALGLAVNIDLNEFFIKNNYEAFIIMGLIADPDHSDSISRDLVLISANGRLFDDLSEALEQDITKLDLARVNSKSSADPEDDNFVHNNLRAIGGICKQVQPEPQVASITDPSRHYKARIWIQRNVTSSRKVVAPLVLKVLHDGAE